MGIDELLGSLGEEVEDVDEEAFAVFSRPAPSQNLGMIDGKAFLLEVSVAGVDFTIHQSPTLLTSDRSGGTTGAVIWKITPLFAEWLSSPDNILFTTGCLDHDSSVIELGCGISALVGLALRPRVRSYLLTDQPYVSKLVTKNIDENQHLDIHAPRSSKPAGRQGRRARTQEPSKPTSPDGRSAQASPSIHFVPLDWEQDDVRSTLSGEQGSNDGGFDVIVACDCVYNDALIQPLVETCAEVSRLRAPKGIDAQKPCLCLVAQQLRSSEVFESWLRQFHRFFRVWQVPHKLMPPGLGEMSGFVVYIGVLRDEVAF